MVAVKTAPIHFFLCHFLWQFFLIRQFPDPVTPGNIVICFWTYLNIMNILVVPQRYRIYSFQNIIPSSLFPNFNIFIIYNCLEGITKIQATVATLSTLKTIWWHINKILHPLRGAISPNAKVLTKKDNFLSNQSCLLKAVVSLPGYDEMIKCLNAKDL